MINEDDDLGEVREELRAATQGAEAKAKADPNAPPPVDMKALAKKWLQAVEDADRAHNEFRTRGRKIVELYAQQDKEEKSKDGSQRRFAMLWANVSVLQPSVYARTPEPVVKRRHDDRDPVARTVSEMQERALVTSFDQTAIDDVMKAVRDDYLLPGRGSAWVRYEPIFEPAPPPQPGQPPMLDAQGQPVTEILADEKVVADFVHWEDLVIPKSRLWREVPWLGRKVYLTRAELKARFGDEKAALCKLDHRPEGVKDAAAPEDVCKATIIEIWSKLDKKCIWISPGCDEALDYSDPHLTLEGFFPAPRPALATCSTKSLIPTADYVYYQDQAEEIDELTARIASLFEQLKLVGFYPSGPSSEGSEAIEIAMKPGQENVLVPVPNWAAFADKGGSAQIQWLPVDQVIKVVQGCFQARKELINDVYQITGISDIARGDTDPNETKGAQVLKSQWGSIRLRDRQKELARFARDLTRIMGEVIADKFQPDTLSRMANMQLPWQAELDQKYQQAMQAWEQQVTQIKLAAEAQLAQTGVAPGQGALGNQGGPQGQAPVGNPASPSKGNVGGVTPANVVAGADAPPGATAPGNGPAPAPLQSGPSEMGGAPFAGPAPNGAPGSDPGFGSHLAQGDPGAPQGAPQPSQGTAPAPQPKLPPQPQPAPPSTVTFDAVLKLMRDDRMRSFRIDIETDSTIEADENEHKARLIEFMGAVSQFMEKALPAGEQHPELIPFLGESMSMLVRGFRVGRQLESTIEESMNALSEKAQNPQNQSNPAKDAEHAKAQAVIVKAQAEAVRADADKQIAAMRLQHEGILHQQRLAEAQANGTLAARKLELAQAEHENALQARRLEAIYLQQQHDAKMEAIGASHGADMSRLEAQRLAAQQSILQKPTGPAAPVNDNGPFEVPLAEEGAV